MNLEYGISSVLAVFVHLSIKKEIQFESLKKREDIFSF